VIASDVVVARQMYFAALKAENPASRFLIIYTALAVFSTFKLGTRVGERRTELTGSSRLRIRPSP